MSVVDEELVARAWEILRNARVPQGAATVGAVVRDAEDTVWQAASIVSESWTVGECAERLALYYALSNGAKEIHEVAIALGPGASRAHPCGTCREAIAEFAPLATVLIASEPGKFVKYRATELFPHPFRI